MANLEAAVAGCPAAREKDGDAAAVAGMVYSMLPTLSIQLRAYTLPEAEKKDSNAQIIDLAKHVGFGGASDAKVFRRMDRSL